MKVLIVSHMYPSTFSTATEIFLHQQVQGLKKLGCEVKVICPFPAVPFLFKYFSEKWKRYSDIPSQMTWDGIDVYYPRYIDYPKGLFLSSSGERMYRGMKKTIEEIYKEFPFDVIHSHVALPDGYAGMMIAKKYKKPLVVTIHGVDFQQTIFKNKKCRNKIKETINFSSKTIVVSEKLKNLGEKELNVANGKIEIIPNGIDYKKDINEAKPFMPNMYRDKIVILSVSNLIITKGVDLNILAIEKLSKKYPNLIYLVIGDGPERLPLENLVKDLNLKNNVKFLGKQSHEKVIEYMLNCNVLSLPSWKEGFGIVYLETMMCGKPIIACKGEGAGDFIKERENGLLVEPKNVESLIKAIDFLISSPLKAREIGENGKKTVLENYTWEKICAKIVVLYNNLAIKLN